MSCLASLRSRSLTRLVGRATLAAAFAALLVAPATAGHAQEGSNSQKKGGGKSTGGLRQEIYEQMQAIQELIEQEKLTEAEARISALQATSLSDYELAQSWYLLGFLHYQNANYLAAETAFERVLINEALPLGLQTNVLRTLSQLSMLAEDYVQALVRMEALLAILELPVPEIYALKAQAHYQLGELDEALASLDEASRLLARTGAPPRENWLLLKNAIFYQRKDLPAMLSVVQELLRLYPRDRYLLNMAVIYGELGDSEKQLSILEPLYERGGLPTENHKINLASLYLLNEVPHKAALLLAEEIGQGEIEANETNLKMLSQAWLGAAHLEEAVEPLAQAAELADSGEDYLALARILMTLTRWNEAEAAAAKALAAGGLRNPASAWIVMGMTQYNQKSFRAARSSFARAGEDPANAPLAKQWMAYLEGEEEKQALLDRAGRSP